MAAQISRIEQRVINRWSEVHISHPAPTLSDPGATVLLRSRSTTNALWISARTGELLTKKNLGTLVSKITLVTIGVDVSPHLFRTAAASTAAAYGSNTPHLASALLNHTDPRGTEEDYTRTTSIT